MFTVHLCLLFLSFVSAELPKPAIEFSFEEGLRNSGTVGSAAVVESHAENEGPFFSAGPWGTCLDMSDASRFGGTLEQTEPAGSSLVFTHDRVRGLADFTVMLWYRPDLSHRPINARLVYCKGSWELLYNQRTLSFLAAEGAKKHSHGFSLPREATRDGWVFLAVTVSADEGKVTARFGNILQGLRDKVVRDLKRRPGESDGTLEVGNLGGIRPFKGFVDSLRLFDSVLSSGQIEEIFESDLVHRSQSQTVWQLSSGKPTERRFSPIQSDIFFRVLSQSRLASLKGYEQLQTYHATRLLWVYGSDPKPIRKVKDMGLFYQGTLNGMAGYQKATPDRSAEGDATGRQRDLDNNKVVLPHMSKWNPEHPRWTGCHNSPEFREIFMKEADALIEAGVDAIHVDDWMITHQTGQHGLACFCPSCTKGFRSYLRETLAPEELVQMGIGDIASFDYAKHLVEREKVTSQIDYRRRFRKLPLTPHFLDFQRESLRSFYEEFRQHLNKASPEGYIPVSVNNQFYSRSRDKSYRGYFAVDVIDFFAGEASRVMQTAPHYIVPCKVAEAFGIPQIMMSKPGPIGASQAALATTYALGQWFRVPWDLYMDITPDGKAAPRYFGKTTDWQPYYDFIHQHPDLFNGYRSAASVGVLFNVDASPYEAVWSACQSLATRQTQFRLVAATGRYGHAGLRRESFEGLRTVIMVSSDETFTVEDRALLDSVKKERRTRFISLSEFERRDRTPMVPLLKLEAPEDIFAFIRVEPNKEPLSAVVHLVNWNLRVGGGNDPFKHLSLGLPFSDEWKGRITARYFQPGRKEVEGLELEWHSGYVRMTVPRLEVWGIVELAAKPGQLRKESLP